jgi:hypothetical protein
VDNVVIIVLGTFLVSFAIAYVSVLQKLSKITQEFAKLYISHQSLQDFVEKNNVEFKNDSDIHKENFIKFLSDSRDWAFGYIEDVQKGLDRFVENLDSEISNFDENSTISEGTQYYDLITKFSKEYKELKKLMPIEPISKDA